MKIYSIYDFQKQILNYDSEVSYQAKQIINLINKKSAIKIPKIIESYFNFKYRLEKDYDKQSFNIKNFNVKDFNVLIK